jgi:putative membrane protein
VKPVLTLLSLPVVLLTLGLFLLLINAAMLGLTSWLAGQLDLGFRVNGFWTAVGGALVITVVAHVADSLIGRDDRR